MKTSILWYRRDTESSLKLFTVLELNSGHECMRFEQGLNRVHHTTLFPKWLSCELLIYISRTYLTNSFWSHNWDRLIFLFFLLIGFFWPHRVTIPHSSAVMTCSKWWPDRMIIFQLRTLLIWQNLDCNISNSFWMDPRGWVRLWRKYLGNIKSKCLVVLIYIPWTQFRSWLAEVWTRSH